MAKKRPELTSAMVDQYFSEPGTKRKAPPPFDVAYGRHTYRTKPETHQALKAVAKDLGVGLNELIRFVHGDFIARYQAGEVEIPMEEYVTSRTIIGAHHVD